MTRRFLLVLSLLLAGACSGDGGDSVAMVDGTRFDPQTLTVPLGATVEFVNRSFQAHSVTAYEDRIPDGAEYFASGGLANEDAARADVGKGLIPAGESYSVTFDEPGSYRYFCMPHEQDDMKGTIVVGD